MSSGSIHSTYSEAAPTHGSHKVKYHPHSDWDFHLDVTKEPIDLSLVLPHYRARNQPIHHRLHLFVGQESGPLKLKICRNFPRTKFYLQVQASTSDVTTIWLPSDFKGQIHHSGKASFSAGFANRIMPNVMINQRPCDDLADEDDVTVLGNGRVAFRMWDVQTGSPETQKEKFKRIFGSSRKTTIPESSVNWDFLLDD